MAVLVSVLGSVTVEHEGRLLGGDAFGARRVRLALAALATASGGRLTAEQLAGRVWSDPPATWPAALRGTIQGLRTTLDRIDLGGQRVVRTAPAGWTLADDVETDLAVAERALTAGAAGAARLVDVLAEEVLPDDEAEWIDALRAERRALLHRALRLAADGAIADGRWPAAARFAERLLDLDPLDEPAHRVLMRALAASGDRAGAIRAFDRCRAAMTDELGVDPDPETTALYLDLLRSGPASGGALPPRAANRFVGRGRELDEIVRGLAGGRPVTVVGRGGIGKSRLALEAAHHPDVGAVGGRFWVALGDLPDAALVPAAVAAGVGADAAADPVASAIDALAPLEATLLVVDGAERHADAVADLASQLLAGVPELRLLVTSRVPLGLDGEARVEVGPLASAGDAADLLRARLGERGGAAVDPASAVALAQRLGGAPLALELAAAQLATVSAADLLDGMDEAADAAADVLDTIVDQSWGALDGDEQRLLRTLGMIEGSVPLALLRSFAPTGVPAPRIARLLGVLGGVGFITVDRSSTRWRYGVDAHLRPFVSTRTGDRERSATLAALLAALGEVVPPDASAPPGPFRDGVLAAMDACRTAFAAAAEGRADKVAALGLAFRLHRFWATTGVAEGRYWLRRLLDGAEDGDAADLARFAAGYLAYWAGDADEALRLLPVSGAALAERHPEYAARSWLYAAGLSDDMDQPDVALAQITRAVEIGRRVPGPFVRSVELGLGAVLAERGDPAAAVAVDTAMALLPPDAPEGQRWFMAAAAALATWRIGDLDAARRWSAMGEPLLGGAPGIARSQLTTAMAALCLRDGEKDRALGFAAITVGDLVAVGGVHEMPIAAAVATRVALEAGEPALAVEYARRAVEAATAATADAPAAPALESVVAVAPADAAAPALAATAARIRERGRRPAPPGLGVTAGPAEPLATEAALALAAAVLDRA